MLLSAFYPPSAISHPRFILHPHFLIRVLSSIRIFSSAFYPPSAFSHPYFTIRHPYPPSVSASVSAFYPYPEFLEQLLFISSKYVTNLDYVTNSTVFQTFSYETYTVYYRHKTSTHIKTQQHISIHLINLPLVQTLYTCIIQVK